MLFTDNRKIYYIGTLGTGEQHQFFIIWISSVSTQITSILGWNSLTMMFMKICTACPTSLKVGKATEWDSNAHGSTVDTTMSREDSAPTQSSCRILSVHPECSSSYIHSYADIFQVLNIWQVVIAIIYYANWVQANPNNVQIFKANLQAVAESGSHGNPAKIL